MKGMIRLIKSLAKIRFKVIKKEKERQREGIETEETERERRKREERERARERTPRQLLIKERERG